MQDLLLAIVLAPMVVHISLQEKLLDLLSPKNLMNLGASVGLPPKPTSRG